MIEIHRKYSHKICNSFHFIRLSFKHSFARRNSNEVALMRSSRQVTFVATKVQLA